MKDNRGNCRKRLQGGLLKNGERVDRWKKRGREKRKGREKTAVRWTDWVWPGGREKTKRDRESNTDRHTEVWSWGVCFRFRADLLFDYKRIEPWERGWQYGYQPEDDECAKKEKYRVLVCPDRTGMLLSTA